MRLVKEIDIKDVKDLYAERMQKDFPFEELRPYRSMKQLAKNDQYVCLGYWEKDTLLAYACFLFVADSPLVLLDLLAVDASLRGQGIGHEFVNLLKQHIDKDILIEVESLASSNDEQELAERQRRINFYLDIGAKKTDVACKLFNVDYDLLVLPNSKETYDYFVVIDDLYQKVYKKVYGKMCQPYRREDEGQV